MADAAVAPPQGMEWPFFVYFGVLLVVLLWTLTLTWQHLTLPGFVLLPVLLLVMAYENLAIAIALNSTSWASVSGVLSVRYALQSFSVPLLLLTCFELAYEVRKKRSSNFFCMTFDQGHRKKEGNCSSAIRYSVWVVSFLLVFVAAIANAEHILAPSSAAFTSTSRFASKSLAAARLDSAAFSLSTFVDVVPEILGLAFALYVGLSLWRYGSLQSMDVSASILNRWAVVAVAAAGLSVAWAASPASWPSPLAYNGCAAALGAALSLTARFIDFNLRELDLLRRSIAKEADGDAAVPVEALPPRFRSGSHAEARTASSRTAARPKEGGHALRSIQSMPAFAVPGDAKGAAPAADEAAPARSLKRPLPSGPRPPREFQGVNPMVSRISRGAQGASRGERV